MANSPPNVLKALVDSCRYQFAEPGAILFEEGQMIRGLHLLVSAKVRLSKHSPAGDLEIQPDIGPGMVLGISEMLGKTPHSVSALVVERGELGFIEAEALTSVLGKRMDSLALVIRTNMEARIQLTSFLIQVIRSIFDADEVKLKNTMASD